MAESDETVTMVRREFTAAIPRFVCAWAVPEDWEVMELDKEQPDFREPTNFLPVGATIAPKDEVLVTVAVRPKFEKGSVVEWLVGLTQRQGLKIQNPTTAQVGAFPAVACIAKQEVEGAPMLMRLHMFEDGGALYNVSVMAPEAMFQSLIPLFQKILATFELKERQGATVPLLPPQGEANAVPADAGADGDAPLHLAEDAGTLDPEHPVNVSIQKSRHTMLARVVSTDPEKRVAVVGCGSILATFSVPFGWHVMDDGKQAVVFEAGGSMQLSMNLVSPEGKSDAQILDAHANEAYRVHPKVEHLRFETLGMQCLGMRGLMEQGVALEQTVFIRRNVPHQLILITRATSRAGHMPRAMRLAELVLSGMRFG